MAEFNSISLTALCADICDCMGIEPPKEAEPSQGKVKAMVGDRTCDRSAGGDGDGDRGEGQEHREEDGGGAPQKPLPDGRPGTFILSVHRLTPFGFARSTAERRPLAALLTRKVTLYRIYFTKFLAVCQ